MNNYDTAIHMDFSNIGFIATWGIIFFRYNFKILKEAAYTILLNSEFEFFLPFKMDSIQLCTLQLIL
jgi:hypothetical protein